MTPTELQDYWDAPQIEWESRMKKSDSVLPRWAEDLIDGMVSEQTKQLSREKKALRSSQPIREG